MGEIGQQVAIVVGVLVACFAGPALAIGFVLDPLTALLVTVGQRDRRRERGKGQACERRQMFSGVAWFHGQDLVCWRVNAPVRQKERATARRMRMSKPSGLSNLVALHDKGATRGRRRRIER